MNIDMLKTKKDELKRIKLKSDLKKQINVNI